MQFSNHTNQQVYSSVYTGYTNLHLHKNTIHKPHQQYLIANAAPFNKLHEGGGRKKQKQGASENDATAKITLLLTL